MEQGLLHNILYGFQVVLMPDNIFYCFLGVLVGTLVGVLPGLGPGAAIAILLPSTFALSPASAIIMLAGIYYGAMYGGSTTSILVNIPGEAASVVTCLDGYKMALQGRAGPALGISAFGSFIGGTIGTFGVMLLAPPLAALALRFGPPEYVSLIVLGFTMLTYLAAGSMIKAMMMACLGIIIGSIGLDSVSGASRFVYGIQTLYDGVGLIPVIMGLFGVSEVLRNVEREFSKRDLLTTAYKGLLPTLQDWKRSIAPILRGTGVGFSLGSLPGGGCIISSFASYSLEKRLSKHPEKFGTGMIEGVAGPETANNVATSGGMVPLLTLGIPTNGVFAIILGAFLIHGVQPGPLLLTEAPDVFWGIIISMYVGNAMLLVLNLPLIGIWVKILKVPYVILFPLILLFCLVGSYSVGNNIGDVYVLLVFGVLGYFMRKFAFEGAPLIFAIVLGRLFEDAIRQSLLISNGSFLIFIQRPISAILLTATLILLISAVIFKRRPEIKESED